MTEEGRRRVWGRSGDFARQCYLFGLAKRTSPQPSKPEVSVTSLLCAIPFSHDDSLVACGGRCER